jgi:hypothetical protein
LNRSHWLARGLAAAALVWCAGLGIWLWVTPIRSHGVTVFSEASPDGTTYRGPFAVERTQSFSEISALGALPLLVPALIAGVGLWGAWRRRTKTMAVSAGIMAIFCVIAGFSIGRGYLPAAAALVWATIANLDARSA